jgi:tRNA threonylcarbamoyladenosine biosynthesis protein TsaB
MLVLAIDTSGKRGGLALFRDNPQILVDTMLEPGTYSAQLVPQLAKLLEQNHLALPDVNGIAVVNGPGSFTGLRVGVGAAKGLAEALQVPVAAISALELVASTPGHDGRVLLALDAGRREAYFGDYETSDYKNSPQLSCRAEDLLTWEQLALRLAELQTRVLTPDAGLAEFLASRNLPVFRVDYPGAGRAAQLGYAKLKLGQTTPVETLDANYIRRSDAELYSLPKLQR